MLAQLTVAIKVDDVPGGVCDLDGVHKIGQLSANLSGLFDGDPTVTVEVLDAELLADLIDVTAVRDQELGEVDDIVNCDESIVQSMDDRPDLSMIDDPVVGAEGICLGITRRAEEV